LKKENCQIKKKFREKIKKKVSNKKLNCEKNKRNFMKKKLLKFENVQTFAFLNFKEPVNILIF